MGTGIANRTNLAFNTAGAEAAGNKNAPHILKKAVCGFIRNKFGINPFDIHSDTIGNPAMLLGFHNADVSVVKLYIFPYQSNGHFSGGSP